MLWTLYVGYTGFNKKVSLKKLKCCKWPCFLHLETLSSLNQERVLPLEETGPRGSDAGSHPPTLKFLPPLSLRAGSHLWLGPGVPPGLLLLLTA